METLLAEKICSLLQSTVLTVCQHVVSFKSELVVQGVISIEADGKEICTVNFKDVKENEANQERNQLFDKQQTQDKITPKPNHTNSGTQGRRVKRDWLKHPPNSDLNFGSGIHRDLSCKADATVNQFTANPFSRVEESTQRECLTNKENSEKSGSASQSYDLGAIPSKYSERPYILENVYDCNFSKEFNRDDVTDSRNSDILEGISFQETCSELTPNVPVTMPDLKKALNYRSDCGINNSLLDNRPFNYFMEKPFDHQVLSTLSAAHGYSGLLSTISSNQSFHSRPFNQISILKPMQLTHQKPDPPSAKATPSVLQQILQSPFQPARGNEDVWLIREQDSCNDNISALSSRSQPLFVGTSQDKTITELFPTHRGSISNCYNKPLLPSDSSVQHAQIKETDAGKDLSHDEAASSLMEQSSISHESSTDQPVSESEHKSPLKVTTHCTKFTANVELVIPDLRQSQHYQIKDSTVDSKSRQSHSQSVSPNGNTLSVQAKQSQRSSVAENGPQFRCSLCRCIFLLEQNLNRHIKFSHGTQLTDSKTGAHKDLKGRRESESPSQKQARISPFTAYPCTYCSHVFPCSASRSDHMTKVHNLSSDDLEVSNSKGHSSAGNVSMQRADAEVASTVRRQSFQNAVRVKTERSEGSVQKWLPRKAPCSRPPRRRASVAQHQHLCSICNASFTFRSNMRRHMRRAHEIGSEQLIMTEHVADNLLTTAI